MAGISDALPVYTETSPKLLTGISQMYVYAISKYVPVAFIITTTGSTRGILIRDMMGSLAPHGPLYSKCCAFIFLFPVLYDIVRSAKKNDRTTNENM